MQGHHVTGHVIELDVLVTDALVSLRRVQGALEAHVPRVLIVLGTLTTREILRAHYLYTHFFGLYYTRTQ